MIAELKRTQSTALPNKDQNPKNPHKQWYIHTINNESTTTEQTLKNGQQPKLPGEH